MSLSTTIKFLQDLAFKKPEIIHHTQSKDFRHFQKVADMASMIAPNSKLVPIDDSVNDKVFDGTPTVWFLNHNDPTSWMPMVPVLCDTAIKEVEKRNIEGYPFVFFHKIVLNTPVVKDIVKHFVGNTVTTYEEVLEILNSGGPYHMGTCPEGSNCLYDYGGPVADFQQFALIKAAIATGATISVITFKQKHPLSVPVKVPFIGNLVKNAKGLRVPYVWLVRNPVNAVYEVLNPGISKQEFNSLTKEQQKVVVQRVGEMIKNTFEMRLEQLEDPA
jgi:hypothetical protein